MLEFNYKLQFKTRNELITKLKRLLEKVRVDYPLSTNELSFVKARLNNVTVDVVHGGIESINLDLKRGKEDD